MLAPLELFGLVLRAKGNVMHRTGREATHRGVGLTKQVNDSARRGLVRGSESKPVARFVKQTIAKTLRE